MEYNNKLSEQWLEMMQTIPSPLTLVITTHLMTEYGINYLISSNCVNHKQILDDRNYTFSIKLNIIYALGLIPEDLYQNIKKLNILRNKFAHSLKVDFRDVDLSYEDPERNQNLNLHKKKWEDEPDNEDVLNILTWISIFTFARLHNLITRGEMSFELTKVT
jgi:hypothetical protein